MAREFKPMRFFVMMGVAAEYFEKQGSGNKQDWDLAFEHGYEDGCYKTH